MTKRSAIVFLTFLSTHFLNAQTQFSGWLASFNTFKLSDKLSLHFDGQLRSGDKWRQVQTILLRPGLNFHPDKKWTLSAGYAFISSRRTVSGLSDLLPEHRTWQQAMFSHKAKNVSVNHRLRFEERFISKAIVRNNELKAEGHDQAFRLRYFIRNIVPFKSTYIHLQPSTFSKGFFFALQNEVFINTGNKSAVNGKSFDQNRFYAAVGYRLPSKFDIEAGYMNQYTATRTSFTNNHIAQVAVYKRL